MVIKYRYKAFGKWKNKKLMELNVEPEHVHGTIILPMTMSPATAKQLLEGGSVFLFFKYCPNMKKRYPRRHLWSKGTFVASIGFIQVEQTNEYVRNQEKHHETIWIEW